MGIMESHCPNCGQNDKWRYNRQWCQRCGKTDPHYMNRFVRWRTQNGEAPGGVLLVEVDTNQGSDVAFVVIDKSDGNTLLKHESEDIWAKWTWKDVSRYARLEDILAVKNVL
jgi:hypothetical protein